VANYEAELRERLYDAERRAYNALVERQMAQQRAAVHPPHDPITQAERVFMGALGLDRIFPGAGAGGLVAPRAVKDQAAEDRAYSLLVGEIGEQAAARIKAGGAYPIHSTLWPGVVYLIPRDGKVRILDRGHVIGQSCLVTTGDMPWPDVVLTRIQRIRDDETVVFSIGIVQT
jgi:hypothetical protein